MTAVATARSSIGHGRKIEAKIQVFHDIVELWGGLCCGYIGKEPQTPPYQLLQWNLSRQKIVLPQKEKNPWSSSFFRIGVVAAVLIISVLCRGVPSTFLRDLTTINFLRAESSFASLPSIIAENPLRRTSTRQLQQFITSKEQEPSLPSPQISEVLLPSILLHLIEFPSKPSSNSGSESIEDESAYKQRALNQKRGHQASQRKDE